MVVAAEAEDLAPVAEREQAEAQLDRTQEPVLAEQVCLGTVREVAEVDAQQPGHVEPRAGDPPGARDDQREHVPEEEDERHAPHLPMRNQ